MGSVVSKLAIACIGIQWQFLALTEATVTIDLTVYALPPVEQIFAFLVWMAKQEMD